ncbi:MAG: hypothetical protein J6I73_07685 [Treponema sp.]|nr:hypothetical protein [Treponema sp.]
MGMRLFIKKLIVTIKYIFLKENKKTEKKLIILGTGSSLNQDIAKIKEQVNDCDVMCVNSYLLNENFEIIKPNIYVLADPSYFAKNVVGLGLNDRNIFIENIKKKLQWNLVLYLPKRAKSCYLVEELSRNEYITIKYITDNELKPFFFNKYKAYNKNDVLPPFYNVLVMCLSIGLYKKYKAIDFYGADHNWCHDLHVGEDNLVYIVEHHCYKEKSSSGMHPSQYEDGRPITMGDMMSGFGKLFNEYYNIQEWANYNGTEIYNKSSVSFIDAFKRK